MVAEIENSKEFRVVRFYVLCNRLKDLIRTGWKNWGVKRKRVESVAEHIYGVQMLAIAIWSEYDHEIDLMKVLSMLAVHELEETGIGDFTPFQISKEEKLKKGHEGVEKILKELSKGEKIKDLIFEYDEQKTKEARFAYCCDKLESDLQCKIYDEQNCVDITKKVSDEVHNDKRVKAYLEKEKSWSKMWIKFKQERYDYKDPFLAISNFVKDNKISE